MSATNTTAPLDPARATESRAYQLTIPVIICPIFATVLVGLRLYTRLVILRKRFWEDFVMVIALICTILMSVFNYLAVVYGSGRHIETITPEDWVEFLKVGIAITQFYSLCHLFVKLSILLQYVRVSVMPFDRFLCQTLIGVLCTGYAIFIVLRMVRCVPFASQWTPNMPGKKCFFNATWFMFASQAWNMVMDVVILLVPLLVLRHSKAPWPQRVLIGVVLAFGASACIISAVRLQTLYPSTTSKDPSWDKVPSAIYGIIEINVGIVCASVVTLRPLYRRLRETVAKGKAGGRAPARDLDAPERRRQAGPVDLALVTGETTQVGSSADREVELGEDMRRSESSVGGKSISLAESGTVVSETSGRSVGKDAGKGSN